MAIAVTSNNISLKILKSALVLVSSIGVLSTLVYLHDYGYELTRSMRTLRIRNLPPKPPMKELIWLMGYPGTGSDRVISMIEKVTGQSMATNYGHIVEKSHGEYHKNIYPSQWLQKEWYREGVWINNHDLPAETEQVYVKTFCTGYCLYDKESGFCKRDQYIRAMELGVGIFWEECAKGNAYLPPRPTTRRWNKTYWKNRVRKVLVLVRNPMEIVGSRFADYARANNIRVSRVGMIDFCKKIDALYGGLKEIRKMRNKRWLMPFLDEESTPCWTEFYRIIMWYHNVHTIALGRDEMMVKYREDFIQNKDETSADILHFAGLSKTNNRNYTPIGDPVRIMFTDEEKENIADFMQAIGKWESPMWDEYFARYF